MSRVPRSVSMGQAGGRDLAHAARPPLVNIEPDTQDTLSGDEAIMLHTLMNVYFSGTNNCLTY